MTADEMRRAANILDAEAESLHYCNTNESGEWVVYYEGQADREAHDEMRALAAKLRAMADTGWQPIETAPKDGTEIDVWCVDPNGEGYRVPDAWWLASLKRWRCHTDGGFRWTHQPTFWRPSPPPPEAK